LSSNSGRQKIISESYGLFGCKEFPVCSLFYLDGYECVALNHSVTLAKKVQVCFLKIWSCLN